MAYGAGNVESGQLHTSPPRMAARHHAIDLVGLAFRLCQTLCPKTFRDGNSVSAIARAYDPVPLMDEPSALTRWTRA